MLGIVRVIVEKIGQSVVQVNGVRQEEGFQIALYYRHGLHPVVGGNFDQLGRSGKTDTHSCTNSVGGSNMVEEERKPWYVFIDDKRSRYYHTLKYRQFFYADTVFPY